MSPNETEGLNRHELCSQATGNYAYPGIVLIVVLVFGSWVRLADLGGAPFLSDELIHYYAARSLAEGDGPRLPSGNEYRRGLEITHLARISMSVIQDPETAARLPSAIFGIISVALFGLIGWRLGGAWVGVWAALLLAIYPEAVLQSRQTRFYTYQLCFGLIALYGGWRAVAPDVQTRAAVRCIWMLVTLVGFAGALRVQVTTLSVVAGWFAAACLVAFRDLAFFSRRTRTVSPAVVTATLGLAIMISLPIMAPSIVHGLINQASYVAPWAESGSGNVKTYYWIFSDALPVLLALAPVAFLLTWVRRPWLGVYLFLWFTIPLALHTFLFPWKAERYVFLSLPGLFLATAIAAAAGCTALRKLLAVAIVRAWRSVSSATAMRVGTAAVLVSATFAVVTSRPFNRSLDAPTAQPLRYWDEAFRIIREHGLDSEPVGSSQPLPALYHWSKVDFVVGSDFLDKSPAGEHLSLESARDWYGGLPLLTKPADLTSRFPSARAFAIAVDRGRWDYGNITPELRETLLAEGEQLCDDRCGDLLLFRWGPDVSEAAPSPYAPVGSTP